MHPTNRNLQLVCSVCMHLKFLVKYISHSMYYKYLFAITYSLVWFPHTDTFSCICGCGGHENFNLNWENWTESEFVLWGGIRIRRIFRSALNPLWWSRWRVYTTMHMPVFTESTQQLCIWWCLQLLPIQKLAITSGFGECAWSWSMKKSTSRHNRFSSSTMCWLFHNLIPTSSLNMILE